MTTTTPARRVLPDGTAQAPGIPATGLGFVYGGRTIWSGANLGVSPGEVLGDSRGRRLVVGLDDEAAHPRDLDPRISSPGSFDRC